MSTMLSVKDRQQLSKWIGGRQNFTLLFKASQDGCAAPTFHAKCDNKGATVTVCYNTDECVFGGYNPLSWNSTSAYTTHNNAFLFKLKFKGINAPKQYPVIPNNANGMYNDQNYGPTFGGGHDMHLFTGTLNRTANYFQGNGSVNIGTSYNPDGDNQLQITNNNLQYLDIEVYQVTDNTVPDGPWRKIPEVSVEELMRKVEKYCPVEGLKDQFVNILLLGQVGSGKSSFFNTVNSVFRGRVTSKARSGGAETSITTMFRMYKIKSKGSEHPMKFRLCDTRGLEEGQGLDIVDLVAILDGHIADGYEFNPTLSITPDSHGYNKSPTMSEKIHCIAFVMDSCTLDVFPSKVLDTLKRQQQKANQRGIPQVILLTKVDKLCPEVSEDPAEIFSSAAVCEAVEAVSQLLALPRSHVFPIQNYESEIELNSKINLPCLIGVNQMLCFADDYLEDYFETH